MAAFAAVTAPPSAWALDPTLSVANYGHRSWRASEGNGPGPVVAIAQTADGYLWLATPTGLQRFDGVRSIPWPLGPEVFPPRGGIRTLFGARDGTLWIGTTRGLASLKQGVISTHAAFEGSAINDIDEDVDGTVWVGGSDKNRNGLLCAVRDRSSQCHGGDGSFGREIVALHRDSANSLWVSGIDRIWNWSLDRTTSHALASSPARADAFRAVTELAPGTLLIGTGYRRGLSKLAHGEVSVLELPHWAKDLAYIKAMRDRDGGIWLGAADFGLVHMHQGRIDAYTAADGLSGGHVLDLFEDREGNVWVATSRGLDQFRSATAVNRSNVNGLQGRGRSILAARDGSLWAGTTSGIYQFDVSRQTWERRHPSIGGLLEDRRGRIWTASYFAALQYFADGRFVPAPGVPPGSVDALAEDSNGDLWIAHQTAGLMRMRHGQAAQTVSNRHTAATNRISTMTVDPVDGSLWLGLWSGEVENVVDGQVRSRFVPDEPHPSPRVGHIRAAADGTVWVATMVSLSRIKHGRVARLTMEDGLPCADLLWSQFDRQYAWISTGCGIAWALRSDIDAWAAAADEGRHVKVRFRLLDEFDGVEPGLGLITVGYLVDRYTFTPKMTLTPDGKIWAVSGDSIVTIDPRQMAATKSAPPVHIQELGSDGRRYVPGPDLRIPPLPRNLRIDYTGLGFAVPEKLQFRYRLHGRDTDWQNAGRRRQAFYSDLSPGRYRFQVTAANENGPWNDQSAVLEFTVEPAWWQMTSLRLAFAAAVALGLFSLYRRRVDELSKKLASESASHRQISSLYQELQERESMVRRLFNANIIGIFTWNLDGRILDANDAFLKIVGYEREDVVSARLTWKELMPPEWDPSNDEIMGEMLATGAATPIEAEYIRKDGSRVPVLIGAALLDARPTEGVAFVLDQTQRNAAQQAARQSDQRTRDMERRLADAHRIASIGYLSAMIAHELNQPLSGVITNASVALRMLDADPVNVQNARAATQRIVRDGHRAADVVQRLREMFSKKVVVLDPMDLNDAAREVVAMLGADLVRGGIELRQELAAGLPPVHGDRIQIQQVILNLLRNAADAMDSVHDRPRRLLIRTEPDPDGGVRLAVRDEGIGMAPQNIDEIFDAFFSTKEGGMGIGLFISKSIVERHHGRIWAEANAGHGMTFSFRLPLDAQGPP